MRLQLTSSVGVLVRCDASIKAMLIDIDNRNSNDFIIEDLDEEHLLVKEAKIMALKNRLAQVPSEEIQPGTAHS